MSPTHNSLPSDITSDHAKQWAYWCQVAFTAASCSGRIWTVKHVAEAPRAVGTVVARSYRAKPTCCWSEPGWWCRGSEYGCLVSPCCRLLQMGSAWLYPPGLCAHNSPLTCTLGFVLSAFVLTTTSQHHQLSGSELPERSPGFAFSCQSRLPSLSAVEQEDARGFRARCVSAIEMQWGTQRDLMLGG